ncbi:MAG TPA: recombinase RecT [Roseococcus sp.]|nr:recombinase RecT [Roseococcus sp.]
MNQIAKRDDTPEGKLRHQLTAMAPQFAMALPSHIKPEKFQRVVMTVAQQNPDMLAADRRSLLGACIKCASDGLIPDGREAALVIFNTKSKDGGWEKRVQYLPMVAGLLKRARNSGDIASVTAQVVYERDRFVWRPAEDRPVEHEAPPLNEDRGKPIGAYALARLKDGTVACEVLTLAEIDKARSVSRSKDKGPWVDWWSEMARKTAMRRLAKWLPMDAEDAVRFDQIARRDDALGQPQGDADAAPTWIEGEASDAAPSKLDILEGAAEAAPADDGWPGPTP